MILEISAETACEIISHPLESSSDRFWLQENDRYVGIDNSEHSAWVEDFSTKEECLNWLEENQKDDK
jgi:hypothetical protein